MVGRKASGVRKMPKDLGSVRFASASIVIFFPIFFIALAGAAWAGTTSFVKIPLDKADLRFGALYVPSLNSVLYQPNKKGPFPTIIYLHGCGHKWWGNPTDGGNAMGYATHFGSLGYATLILNNLDERNLQGRPCTEDALANALIGARSADLDAAVAWLVAKNIAMPDEIVAFGSSHGASTVVENDRKTSGRAALAGGIALYGCWGRTDSAFARYRLLLLVGALDDSDQNRSLSKTCGDYANFANGMSGSAHVDIVVFPDAGHDFDKKGLAMHKEVFGQDLANILAATTALPPRPPFSRSMNSWPIVFAPPEGDTVANKAVRRSASRADPHCAGCAATRNCRVIAEI
jgi:dienelactone hydrolase